MKTAYPITLVLLGLLASCAGEKRSIRIAPNTVVDPDAPPARPAARPYVIKMSDGERTWQFEIPAGQGAPAFEARIPLQGGLAGAEASQHPATEADREIIDAKRARGEPVPEDGAASNAPPSYLKAVGRVRELYAQRQYELALVELVSVERAFRDDVLILSMKGTLLERLGRSEEARAAWERVLTLDPDNAVVLEALDGLTTRGN